MDKRYLIIWLPFLKTDWHIRNKNLPKNIPIAIHQKIQNKMMLTEVNAIAIQQNITSTMLLADAKTVVPHLISFDDDEIFFEKIIAHIADWCIRFSPDVGILTPNDIVVDVTGCTHLWKGEQNYLNDIYNRLAKIGYQVYLGLASTIGTAWAVAHYQKENTIVQKGKEQTALYYLPPACLRIDELVHQKLIHLGLKQFHQIVAIKSHSLMRRFGHELVTQIQYALGYKDEFFKPIKLKVVFTERLPCIEPITTRIGIEIALKKMLEMVCLNLKNNTLGIRIARFTCYRIDGKSYTITIHTQEATINVNYVFKLFELKIKNIAPGLGIELFVLEAIETNTCFPKQNMFWQRKEAHVFDKEILSLVDKVSNKLGVDSIYKYLPQAHYWPERSFKKVTNVLATKTTHWNNKAPRPTYILTKPELIHVAAPVPDYPPILFTYKNKVHKIMKADGPERIEQEWWIKDGSHRDYFYVEDQLGQRYWLFRLGHYDMEKNNQWYLHGFFA